MKKNILFLMVLHCFFLFSSDDDTHWKQGYELLQNNQYQAALSQFLSIEPKNAALYLLIADCYQNLGHDMLKEGYQEKAFVVATLQQKIRMLDQECSEIQETTMSFYRKKIVHVLYALVVSVPLIIWQLLFLLLVFLLLFSKGHIAVRIVIFFMLLLIGFVTKQKCDIQKPRAIVLRSETALFLVPSENAPVVVRIDKGTRLFLLEQKNDYLKVKKEDNQIGWVLSANVFSIVPL